MASKKKKMPALFSWKDSWNEVMGVECYCRTAVISNEGEWKEHLAKVVKSSESKTQEELLEEALTFDFKFDFIPQRC